jgi:hypothetical protein
MRPGRGSRLKTLTTGRDEGHAGIGIVTTVENCGDAKAVRLATVKSIRCEPCKAIGAGDVR